MSASGSRVAAGPTLVLVALLGVVGWLLFAGDGSDGAPAMLRENAAAASDAAPGDLRVAEAGGAVAADTTQSPAPERSAAELAAPSPAEDGFLDIVMRGRAVDSEGRPLAGVEVDLRGWQSNQAAMDRYLAAHGEVRWEDPAPTHTGADGRFEIAFRAPPPWQFVLSLRAEGRVRVQGRWSTPEFEPVMDFGDIEVRRGSLLSGRLVDAAGRPLPAPERARLYLQLRSKAAEPGPRRHWQIDVAEDGRFETDEPLAAGTWDVRGRGLLLPEPQSLHLDGSPAEVEVVVVPPGEVAEIRGEVVDQAGQPLGGAEIDPPPGSGREWGVWTDSAGRFVMQQWRGVDSSQPIALTARKDGYESASTAEPVPWGSMDLRFVLRQAAALQVHVVRAEGGEPVEEYGLRVVAGPGVPMRSPSDREVRDGWQHEAGVTKVRGLQPGRHLLHVETRRGSGLALAARWVEIPERPPLPTVTVPLQPAVEQVVRLVDGDGAPVAGSEVELIDPDGERIEVDTWVRDFHSNSYFSHPSGWMADQAETDAAGEVVVRGAAGHPYVLRCLGDHRTLLVPDVKLSTAPAVHTVDRGATLRLRFAPLDVLAAWRELVAENGQGPGRWDPAVHLSRVAAAGQPSGYHPLDGGRGESVALDDQGVAELTGVGAGRWDVWLQRPSGVVPGQRLNPRPVFVGVVEIPASGTQELDFDITGELLGEVRCLVLVDDEPHAQRGWLRLQRTLAVPKADGSPAVQQFSLPIDDQGQIAGRLAVGTWSGSLQIEGAGGVMTLPTVPELVVEPGESSEVVLRAFVQSNRLRVVDASGRAVGGVRLEVSRQTERGWSSAQAAPTDGEGRTEIRGAAGSYSVQTRIRSLQSQEALNAFQERLREEHDNDFSRVRPLMDATIVDLGTVVLPGEGEQVLVLPADWDR